MSRVFQECVCDVQKRKMDQDLWRQVKALYDFLTAGKYHADGFCKKPSKNGQEKISTKKN